PRRRQASPQRASARQCAASVGEDLAPRPAPSSPRHPGLSVAAAYRPAITAGMGPPGVGDGDWEMRGCAHLRLVIAAWSRAKPFDSATSTALAAAGSAQSLL